MSALDDAGLAPARDGGPPSELDAGVLDRLAYASTIGPVSLLAERLLLRVEDPDLAKFLGAFLAGAPREDSARVVLSIVEVHGRCVTYLDGLRALTMPSVPAMARALVWYLNRLALAAPNERVLVHSSVAAIDGRAVVLPGVSGAGKTTLALALLADGWEYLSDEVASLDRDGRVHPYPRPLALEEGAWGLFPEALLRWPPDVPELVTDLRLVLPRSVAPPPATVAAFVFPEVRPGATAHLVPLRRSEAMERLVSLTFNLRHQDGAGFVMLADFVRTAACRTLVLDGVAAAPRLLRSLLTDIAASGRY